MFPTENNVTSELLSFWSRTVERCGYIDLQNNIFELPNIHEDKQNGFELAGIPPEAVAIWHTHPSGCPNLSIEDFHLFSSLPQLLHIIVGIREVAYYFVEVDGSLLRGNPHVPS